MVRCPVLVAAGATTAKFAIKSFAISLPEEGNVSATVGTSSIGKRVAVRPMGVAALAQTPSIVYGSLNSVGKITLECKAGPGPITVNLSSNNLAVAGPVASSIVVPQALTSATFDIATNPVLAKMTATISGAANGIEKSKVLNVTPAAVVNPTGLRFGSVTVGTASPTLNVVLYNKGSVPFSVTGLKFTGTYAAWFAQTHEISDDQSPGPAPGFLRQGVRTRYS